MNQKIEINLSNKLNKELELIIAEEGLSKSEFIKKAIEDYLYIRKFRAMRKKLSKKAKGNGFNSDEDIFKALS
jgi:metal-responsive CopG/Arc/MetJ family transcriptional regulator